MHHECGETSLSLPYNHILSTPNQRTTILKMKVTAIAALLFLAPAALALDKPLDIKVDRAGECTRKSKAGTSSPFPLFLHYTTDNHQVTKSQCTTAVLSLPTAANSTPRITAAHHWIFTSERDRLSRAGIRDCWICVLVIRGRLLFSLSTGMEVGAWGLFLPIVF